MPSSHSLEFRTYDSPLNSGRLDYVSSTRTACRHHSQSHLHVELCRVGSYCIVRWRHAGYVNMWLTAAHSALPSLRSSRRGATVGGESLSAWLWRAREIHAPRLVKVFWVVQARFVHRSSSSSDTFLFFDNYQEFWVAVKEIISATIIKSFWVAVHFFISLLLLFVRVCTMKGLELVELWSRVTKSLSI